MMIESVRLHGFRNYDDEMITFPKAIILLYGKNGQGKTEKWNNTLPSYATKSRERSS